MTLADLLSATPTMEESAWGGGLLDFGLTGKEAGIITDDYAKYRRQIVLATAEACAKWLDEAEVGRAWGIGNSLRRHIIETLAASGGEEK